MRRPLAAALLCLALPAFAQYPSPGTGAPEAAAKPPSPPARIADVADKYQVPMVKITGSQRIDLLGVKKADLPAVWADLGMPSA